MGTDNRILALALAAGVFLAGCGKPQSQSQPVAEEPPAPIAAAEPSAPSVGPFSGADQALMDSFEAALFAFQTGDYARAASGLRLLAKAPGQTPEQKLAVQNLLALTLKAAPELATSPVAPGSDGVRPGTTPESTVAALVPVEPDPALPSDTARPGGAEFTRKSLASAFARASQALKESYDSALVAVQIGNYDRAVDELRALAENSELTTEQQKAVQDLLAQALKEAPELAPGAGPGTPK